MFAAILLTAIAGCGIQPPSAPSPSVTSSAPAAGPSWAASHPPSPVPSREGQPPTVAPDGAHTGILTRYCDLGACCPAVNVDGSWYGMQLPGHYRWRHTETGYVIRDRRLALQVAAEGDVIAVRGTIAGPQTCWAAILELGLEVTEIARTEAD